MKKTVIFIIMALLLTLAPACGEDDEGADATIPTTPPAPEGARASFTMTASWDVATDGDIIQSGTHNAVAGVGISVFNTEDLTKSFLPELSCSIEADDIQTYTYGEYAVRDGDTITWSFPETFDLAQGDWLWMGYNTSDTATVDVPISLRRVADVTVFAEDGYQHVDFFLTFDHNDFDSAYIQIIADEDNRIADVDALLIDNSLVTDLPYTDILQQDEEKMYLRILSPEVSQILPGREYGVSVDVRVELANPGGPPVLYKPFGSVGIEESTSSTEKVYGHEVEMLAYLLPEGVRRAWVSNAIVNTWYLSLFRQKTFMLQEICRIQE